MINFDTDAKRTRRNAWIFIVSLVGLGIVFEMKWIGHFTFLDTIFNWKNLSDYLSNNNEGFFIAAVIGIYLEIIKPNTISALFRARLETLDAFLRRTTNTEGIRFFLEREYSSDAMLDDLVQTVVSDKPVLYESQLTLTISDSPNSSALYLCDYRLAFTADFDLFTLGFARTPMIAERLIHDCPDMTEVVVLDHEPNFRDAVKSILSDNPVRVNGLPLPFETLSLTLPSRSCPINDGTDYVTVSANLPKSKTDKRLDFVINYTTSLPRELGRQYWIADRPMYMREISINLAGLSTIDQMHFDLLSFLGSVEDIGKFNMRTGKAHVHVGHWLVRGQGICVIWRRHPMNTKTTKGAESIGKIESG